jgi:hypothetical protein
MFIYPRIFLTIYFFLKKKKKYLTLQLTRTRSSKQFSKITNSNHGWEGIIKLVTVPEIHLDKKSLP